MAQIAVNRSSPQRWRMSLSKSPLLSSAKMPAYVRASLPVRSAVEPHEADRKLLAQLATRIIQIEGPIHIEDIARRIAASFGRERAGSRISSATQEALKLAERLSSDTLNQESFWLTRGQLESPPVRDRSADEGAPSKASNISILELKAALRLAREDNAGGDPAELIRTAARLLGFRRVGPELQARLRQALEQMDASDCVLSRSTNTLISAACLTPARLPARPLPDGARRAAE